MSAAKDILIIDDDRDLVDTLRIVLESKKYGVRVAYDGKEGFDRIEEKLPDLIILDVMMATDTEGFDLAYKLKNMPEFRDIPIIMATSFPQALADKGPGRFQPFPDDSWPVSYFIEKPVEPAKLLATVADILRETGRE